MHRFRSLLRGDRRREAGVYLAEGGRLVAEALASGAEVRSILVTHEFEGGPFGPALIRAAGEADVAVERVPAADLARLSDTKSPQGVVAVVAHRGPDLSVLRTGDLFLALDGVADPGNVGTLVRAADAFGARAVIAGPHTAGFENPKVLRAAMGSTFHVELFRVPDLVSALGELRGRGVRLVAAVLDGDDLYGFEWAGPGLCVILGNEGRGISSPVLSIADRRLTVPCPGRAESLNVAMAGAIMLSRLSSPAREGAV